MKKLFYISCFIVVSALTASCTAEQIETTKTKVTEEVNASGGDQSGQLPTKRPKS